VSAVRLIHWSAGAICGFVAAAACSIDDNYTFDAEAGSPGGASGGIPGGAGAGATSAAGAMSNGARGGTNAGPSAPGGLVRGATCSADGDCADGHCMDGVCCESKCDSGCLACVSSKTGQPDGSCAGVRSGTDPDDECAQDDAPCGLDGTCNGAGSCLYAGPSTECAPESCSDGMYTTAGRCDGTGTCIRPAALACENCSGNTCMDTCSESRDCSSGFYCEERVCVAKKVNGAACEAADECSSDFCVEGVCCDTSCDQACNSCLLDNTGKPDGTCSPVKAGTSDGTCPVTEASSCGFDGTCDGAGSCRHHAQGTPCTIAECLDATTSVVSSACNGAGACTPQQTTPCGNYACSAGRCVSSCVSTASCSPSAYCNGGVCVAGKQPGAVCAADEECSSRRCGSRCCPDGSRCNCPVPQAANLLSSPGFDGLDDWTVGTGPIQYSLRSGPIEDPNYDDEPATYDANDCPFSKGLVGSNPSGSASAAQANRVSQCVTLPSANSEYSYGVNHAWGVLNMGLDFYTTENCSGSPASSQSGGGATGTAWRAVSSVFQSGSYKSVRLSFYTQGAFVVLDQAFVAEAPASWF